MLINSQMPSNDTDVQFERIPESSTAQCVAADFTGQNEVRTRLALVVTFPLGKLLHKCGLFCCPHSPVIIVVPWIFFHEVFGGTIILLWLKRIHPMLLGGGLKASSVGVCSFLLLFLCWKMGQMCPMWCKPGFTKQESPELQTLTTIFIGQSQSVNTLEHRSIMWYYMLYSLLYIMMLSWFSETTHF